MQDILIRYKRMQGYNALWQPGTDHDDQFMMANAKFFPPMMVGQIKDKLATLGEDKETMLISTDWKNPTVGFLFAFFLGGFGADRFWLGDTGLAVVKLITCGAGGIWSLIDLFTVGKRTREYNYKKFMTYF